MKRKKPSKTTGSEAFANPEIGQIEQLLRFMSEHNLEEFEYSRGDLRIRLKKPGSNVLVAARPAAEIIVPGAVPVAAAAPASAGATGGSPSASTDADLRGGEDLFLVKSPIVGTFYGSPSPGAGMIPGCSAALIWLMTGQHRPRCSNITLTRRPPCLKPR